MKRLKKAKRHLICIYIDHLLLYTQLVQHIVKLSAYTCIQVFPCKNKYRDLLTNSIEKHYNAFPKQFNSKLWGKDVLLDKFRCQQNYYESIFKAVHQTKGTESFANKTRHY